MALTATATKSTLECVQARLSMQMPIVVGLSPLCDNMFYSIQPYLDLKELTALLAEDIREKSQTLQKPLCSRIQDTALLYMSLKKALGKHFTYPVGYPNLQQLQLVDMYS